MRFCIDFHYYRNIAKVFLEKSQEIQLMVTQLESQNGSLQYLSFNAEGQKIINDIRRCQDLMNTSSKILSDTSEALDRMVIKFEEIDRKL